MTGRAPVCLNCKHWHQDNEEAFTCDAFPGGIPEPIYMAENDHSRPYPGDHGIQFEPMEAATKKRAAKRGKA